ncbi:hypothetical protein ACLB2K_007999 [Fragaria x ananassa]
MEIINAMDPSLYKAAASGDIRFLKELRAGNRPVDILLLKTPKGNNALHIAPQFKHTNFFKQLPSTFDLRCFGPSTSKMTLLCTLLLG